MDFVEEKLREWGLERFLPAFQENEIDREGFYLLEDEIECLKELIPAVGPRLKLKKELKLLKASDDARQASGSKLLSSSSCDSDSGGFTDDGSLVSDNLSEAEPDPSIHTPVRPGSSSTPTASAGRGHIKSNGQPSKRMRMDFNITEILKAVHGGDELVEEMSSGLLSPKTRKRVVNTLVSCLIEKHGKHPPKDVKMLMTKAIMAEFPSLDNEDGDGHLAWYTPGICGHDASGLLENRLRNLRKRNLCEKAVTSLKEIPKPNLVSTVDLALSEDMPEDADMTAMINWLKHHNAPAQQVTEMMKQTCRYRANKIRTEKERPLRELLKEYPRLIDTDGMVEQDFRILFPELCDSLYMKWPGFCTKVIQYADRQLKWRPLLNLRGMTDGDDEESNVALQLLGLLFPTGSQRTAGRKGPDKRATVEEALQSFIQIEEIGTNIPTFLEGNKQTQPFILALGERKSPEQLFVVVEGQTVSCSSLLHAVDVCFKLFYLLDVHYPWQCSNTWDFVQKFIYGIGDGKGKGRSASAVTLLCNYLKAK